MSERRRLGRPVLTVVTMIGVLSITAWLLFAACRRVVMSGSGRVGHQLAGRALVFALSRGGKIVRKTEEHRLYAGRHAELTVDAAEVPLHCTDTDP